jgi:hypothetical protein
VLNWTFIDYSQANVLYLDDFQLPILFPMTSNQTLESWCPFREKRLSQKNGKNDVKNQDIHKGHFSPATYY